jgi:hypothetical protein
LLSKGGLSTQWIQEEFGGADGIRTHDLLDAIEARSQLRHGPTAKLFLVYHIRSRSKFAQCPKFTHLCTQPNPLNLMLQFC